LHGQDEGRHQGQFEKAPAGILGIGRTDFFLDIEIAAEEVAELGQYEGGKQDIQRRHGDEQFNGHEGFRLFLEGLGPCFRSGRPIPIQARTAGKHNNGQGRKNNKPEDAAQPGGPVPGDKAFEEGTEAGIGFPQQPAKYHEEHGRHYHTPQDRLEQFTGHFGRSKAGHTTLGPEHETPGLQRTPEVNEELGDRELAQPHAPVDPMYPHDTEDE